MARILAIGIATLDIINSVDGYPAEDSEVRARSQRICRGGNATNTLVVLSQLGHRGSWGGVLVDEPDARHIRSDLAHYAIDTAHVRLLGHGKVPTSYISHNLRNGSRSIVHYRDLPEFGYHDFAAIDLGGYDWLHFEGRNIDDTARMMQRAREHWPTLPISLEIEKERDGLDQLLPLADVILASRALAETRGFADGKQFLHYLRKLTAADLYCGWGSLGAHALIGDQALFSPAQTPAMVIDTLGAGDTFNAAIIDGYLDRREDILSHACTLASLKCGRLGLDLGLELGI